VASSWFLSCINDAWSHEPKDINESVLLLKETAKFIQSHTATYKTKTSLKFQYSVEPGYNDISLYDTSSITSGVLWYQ